MGKALLVIDMQKGSFTEETPRYDADGVVIRINSLAKKFRSLGNHVIFIQHDGSKQNDFVPSSTDWELLSSLNVLPDDVIIQKTANDSFYKSNLSETLLELGANELFITGCATDFCVSATVQSAIVKDYEVTVVKNAHTTADRPHFSAKQVISYYNWIWQNMTPTKRKIELIDSEEIEETLTAEYANQ